MHRKNANFPPFCRLIKIELSSTDYNKVDTQSNILLNLFPKNYKSLTIYFPIEPTIAKLNNIYRKVIYLKSNKSEDKSGKLFQTLIKETMSKYYEIQKSNDIKVTIDIDSYSSF